MKDKGVPTEFLGMQVTVTPTSITLSHSNKITELADSLGWSECRRAYVPIASDSTFDDLTNITAARQKQYASAVGSLSHIATFTRPDIAFTVSALASHIKDPRLGAWHTLQQVERYLVTTKDYAVTYTKPDGQQRPLVFASDANWALVKEKCATSGSVFLVNGQPVHWKSKRQTLTAQSTCEAEFVAAAETARIGQILRDHYHEIWGTTPKPAPLLMDSRAVDVVG